MINIFSKCPVEHFIFFFFFKEICFAIVLRIRFRRGEGDVVDTSFRDSMAISRGEKRVGIKNCTPYWGSRMRLIN